MTQGEWGQKSSCRKLTSYCIGKQIHTQTHTHTYTHPHTQTHTHTLTHTDTHTYTHTHTHIHSHTHTHTHHTHSHTHTHTHTLTHTHTQTDTPTLTHPHTQPHTHTHRHTQVTVKFLGQGELYDIYFLPACSENGCVFEISEKNTAVIFRIGVSRLIVHNDVFRWMLRSLHSCGRQCASVQRQKHDRSLNSDPRLWRR